MESMRSADLVQFLQSLSNELPAQAIKALVDEVKRHKLDGAHFDQVLAGRSSINLGGAVRPQHLQAVRRCWSTKHGIRPARAPSQAGTGRASESHAGSSMGNSDGMRRSVAGQMHQHKSRQSQARFASADRASVAESTPVGHRASQAQAKQMGRRSKSAHAAPDAGASRSSSHNSRKEKDDNASSKSSIASSAQGFAPPPRKSKSEKVLPTTHEEVASYQSSKSSGKNSNPVKEAWVQEKLPEKPAPPPVTPEKSAPVRRTISEVDSPITPLAPVKQSRRPPQVPPLDLSFIHKKDGADKESKPPSEAKVSVAPAKAEQQQQPAIAPAGRIPPGYAVATPEDQQRIAAFYGYRDQGFKATMHGLRTSEIRPRLYLGTMADAAYWPLLKALGISHVLNCATEAQNSKGPYEAHGIKYLFMPLHDTAEEAGAMSKQHFKLLREATRFIHTSLKSRQNTSVFVHCVQGLSRSAALVCAYLIEFEGLPMDRALADIRSRHKGCLSSHHWQALLYKFETEFMNKSSG